MSNVAVISYGQRKTLVSCCCFHSLPLEGTVSPEENIKTYSLKGILRAGWVQTSDGWMCPKCAERNGLKKQNYQDVSD